MPLIGLQDHYLYTSTIQDHLRQTVLRDTVMRSDSLACGCTRAAPKNWTGWVQGYGQSGDLDGNSNAAGLNYNTGGVLVGADRWLSDQCMVGFSGG